MKTETKKTIKKLTLNKETLAILDKAKQWKLFGGDGGPKGGDGKSSSQLGPC